MSEIKVRNEKDSLDIRTIDFPCIFFNEKTKEGFISTGSFQMEHLKEEGEFLYSKEDDNSFMFVTAGGWDIKLTEHLFVMTSEFNDISVETALTFEEIAHKFLKSEGSSFDRAYYFSFDYEKDEDIFKNVFEKVGIKKVKSWFEKGDIESIYSLFIAEAGLKPYIVEAKKS